MSNPTKTQTLAVTFCDVLDNPEARRLVDQIEDYRASWDGENRYAWEIETLIGEVKTLTGYQMD